MTTRKEAKKKLETVDRLLENNQKLVIVRELAKKSKLNPSTISRRLKAKAIPVSDLRKSAYTKEKLRPVALLLLGINRNQIKRLTGEKSERLKARVNKLFFTKRGEELFFDEQKVARLKQELEKHFDLGECVGWVCSATACSKVESFFSVLEETAYCTHEFDSFMEKVSGVTGRDAQNQNGVLVVKGHKDQMVKITLKHLARKFANTPNS